MLRFIEVTRGRPQAFLDPLFHLYTSLSPFSARHEECVPFLHEDLQESIIRLDKEKIDLIRRLIQKTVLNTPMEN